MDARGWNGSWDREAIVPGPQDNNRHASGTRGDEMMVSEPRNSHYLSLSQGRYIEEPWRPEDDEILVSMRRGNRPAT